MIKRINTQNLLPSERYDDLISFLKDLNGQYVVLLKDMVLHNNGIDFCIEKGSLVRLKDISLAYLTDSRDKQDYYCEQIQIESINDEGVIYTSTIYECKNTPKNEKECLQNLHKNCDYLSEYFGSTDEIEKISKKLNKYTDKDRLPILSALSLIGTILLGILFGIIAGHTSNVIQGIFIFLVVLCMICFFVPIASEGEIDIVSLIIEPLYKRKHIKYWKHYDSMITDIAKNPESISPLLLICNNENVFSEIKKNKKKEPLLVE